jgi:hypothetical protein
MTKITPIKTVCTLVSYVRVPMAHRATAGCLQRASAEKLRIAIDVGRKQYWPKPLK